MTNEKLEKITSEIVDIFEREDLDMEEMTKVLRTIELAIEFSRLPEAIRSRLERL